MIIVWIAFILFVSILVLGCLIGIYILLPKKPMTRDIDMNKIKKDYEKLKEDYIRSWGGTYGI